MKWFEELFILAEKNPILAEAIFEVIPTELFEIEDLKRMQKSKSQIEQNFASRILLDRFSVVDDLEIIISCLASLDPIIRTEAWKLLDEVPIERVNLKSLLDSQNSPSKDVRDFTRRLALMSPKEKVLKDILDSYNNVFNRHLICLIQELYKKYYPEEYGLLVQGFFKKHNLKIDI